MSIAHKHGTVQIIYVNFNDNSAGLVTMRGDIIAQQQHWVSIQKYEVSFPIKKNKPHPSFKRTQFPLVLSWTCTIHKVQGLTLKEGVVNFKLQRQKNVKQGEMYVAMGRISKFENMYLLGKYHGDVIKVNQNAKREYKRLHITTITPTDKK